jgi:outer membrane protein assembly factor BamB
VHGLAASGSRLYVTGNLTFRGGERAGLVALNARSGRRDPRFRAPGLAWGSDVLVDGPDVFVSDVFGNGFAAFDRRTGKRDRRFRPGVGGSVLALAASGSRLYVGGSLVLPGDETAQRGLVALDARTGALDMGFRAALPAGVEPEGEVTALARAGRRLYASGHTGQQTYLKPGRLTALDPGNGRRLHGFRAPKLGVSFLAPIGSWLFASADRDSSDNWLATLSASTGRRAGSSAPQLDGPVCAAIAVGKRVLLGGNFATVDGHPQNNLAQLAPPR